MGFIGDLLKDIPTVGVAHERIALAEAKYAALEEENKRLKEENSQLKGELDAARKLVPSDDFVEHRGVLFKRRAGGKVDPDAYCPHCKIVMHAGHDFFLPSCRCGIRAPFKQGDLPQIVAELNGKA